MSNAMIELSNEELNQVDGGGWGDWALKVAGAAVLGGLLMATGVGEVGVLVAGVVYTAEEALV